MEPYKSQIAKKFLNALNESDSLIYQESWCGCDWGMPLLEIRLEWERYYSSLTRLGRDLVENRLDGAIALKKLEKLVKPLEGYRKKDFCISAWHATYRHLSEFSGILINLAHLDRNTIMKYLDMVERQTYANTADQRTTICISCKDMNDAIKAFQVNCCPRYRSALELFIKVRESSCMTLDELCEISASFSLPHYEEKFQFDKHGYRNDDHFQRPPRYKCLEELQTRILCLASEIYRESKTN